VVAGIPFLDPAVDLQYVEILVKFFDGTMVRLSLKTGLGIFCGVGFDGISRKRKLVIGFLGEGTLAHRQLFTKINKIIILIIYPFV
jgi:hypothetical protein